MRRVLPGLAVLSPLVLLLIFLLEIGSGIGRAGDTDTDTHAGDTDANGDAGDTDAYSHAGDGDANSDGHPMSRR